MPGWLVASEGQLTLALDIEVSEELKAEGVARELVNRVQNIRKDSGFDVTDKVYVEIFADGVEYDSIKDSLKSFGEYLSAQTLALSVALYESEVAPSDAQDVEWNETSIKIKVTKQ